MKQSLGSFINLNRTSLMILGLVLGIAGFGTIAWNVGAQNGRSDAGWTQEEIEARAATVAARMAADEQSNGEKLAVPTIDSPAATFNADPGSLGPIPDSPAGGTVCGDYTALPRDVTFTVTGMTAPLTDVRVSFQTGAPVHTWVTDLRVSLRAPGGAPEHLIFSQTGSTTPDGCGSGDDIPNIYNFFDTAPAAPTWWAHVAATGTVVPGGDFRTSTTGGVVGGGANTLMTPTFAGLSAGQINGTWTLRVLDGGAGDTGSISAATLTLTAAAGTPTPTNTPTATPTNTPTATPTATPVGTATPTNTPTATPTATPAGTATPTATPTVTPTPPPGSCAAASTTLYAYDFTNISLVRFNAATPGTFTLNNPIVGLGATEFLTGIDFRPANGNIYGVASNNAGTFTRTVAVNFSGQLVNVGADLPGTADVFFGVDFNPVPDRIRVIGDADTSRRLNPDNGALAGTDTALAYVAGDPGFGANPNVVHVAYTNSQAGATLTTLYGIDSNRDVLVRIGGPDGTPSPNTGQLTTIGPLGVDVTSFGGFDIQPGTNTAYAALRSGGVQRLYTIDLATGAATLIGAIGGGANSIDGLTVAPCVTAAGVEVSGRVLTPDGRGLRNATVLMTDGSGAVRTATTSTFGYYRFDDVEVGGSYVMAVESRRYRFAPRVVQVFDNLSDLDFAGQE